ncbi:MAG: tetratricopeptide repeat protein [Acidimicrobiia bacterium]
MVGRAWLMAVVIVLLTLTSFLPVLQNDFVAWDDGKNFLENPGYRGLGAEQIRWMFTNMRMGHYIPLTWLTLGFDYAVWGMDARGYHLTSLVLHAATAVAFFFVARRLLASGRSGDLIADRAASAGAALAALLFAVHPLRVESVAWATERRDVLSGLFYLIALLAYSKDTERMGGRRSWYWASLGLFACALLSKSTAVSLVPVLLILDIYPFRRVGGRVGWWTSEARRIYAEKLPFAVLATAASIVAFVALIRLGNMASIGDIGLPGRVAISIYSIAFYLWKTILPVHLSPMYELKPHPNFLSWPFLLSAIVVAAATALALVLRRRWPPLLAGWTVYLVALLPVLGIFQNGPQMAADRYSYLACLPWALMAGAALTWYWRARPARPRVGVVAARVAATILVLGGLTWQQTRIWRNDVSLWSHALSLDPTNSVAANNLGVRLLAEGRVAEEQRYLAQTVETVAGRPMDPRDSVAARFFSLGEALQRGGDFAGAARYYEQALVLDPRLYEAWNNLGVIHVTRGEFLEGLAAFVRALETNPTYQAACDNGRRAAKIVDTTAPVLERCGRADGR